MKSKKKLLLTIVLIFAVILSVWDLNKPKEIGQATVNAVHIDMENEEVALAGAIIGGLDERTEETTLPMRMAEAKIILYDNDSAKVNYKVVYGGGNVESSKIFIKFYDENHDVIDEVELDKKNDSQNKAQEFEEKIKVSSKAYETSMKVKLTDEKGSYELKNVGESQVFKK